MKLNKLNTIQKKVLKTFVEKNNKPPSTQNRGMKDCGCHLDYNSLVLCKYHYCELKEGRPLTWDVTTKKKRTE